MPRKFEKGDPVVLQGTIKGTVIRTLEDGQVIVEFGAGAGSRVVSPLMLTHGAELEEVDYS